LTNFYSISFLIDKGKLYYLVNMCRECFEAKDENAWKIVEKMVSPDISNETVNEEERNIYKNYLRGSMLYSDDEFVKLDGDEEETTENLCLHYALSRNNLGFVNKIHECCYPAAGIKNMKIEDGELKPHQTPEELVKSATDLYSNLGNYGFVDVTPSPAPDPAVEGYRSIPSPMWRVLNTDKNLNEWQVDKISFFSSSKGVFDSNIRSKIRKSFDSSGGENISFEEWKGQKDQDGNTWIAIDLIEPIIVQSIKLTHASVNRTTSLKLQAYNDFTDEWVTTWQAGGISSSDSEQLLNYSNSKLPRSYFSFDLLCY